MDQRKRNLAALKIDKLFPSLMNDKEKAELRSIRKNIKKQPVKLVSQQAVSNSSILGLNSYMEDLVDPVTGLVRDLKVDDRALPEAKNYYDFVCNVGKEGSDMPWARQFIPSIIVLGEYCPKCSNHKFLNPYNVPKDFYTPDLKHLKRLTFLENGVCPICGTTKREIINSNLANFYTQFVYVWGQRSGKSSTAALICAYLIHRYLKYPNLSTMTKFMSKSTTLTGIFCSQTYEKARDLLWKPFQKNIENIKWFQDYFDLLDSYKKTYGRDLYDLQKDSLIISHKNLRVFPTGPTASKLRGNTSIFCVLDELGMFPLPDPTKDTNDMNRHADADEAYTSLNNSLLTVNSIRLDLINQGYNSVPPSLMGSVSSPIDDKDKVMRLLKESEGSSYLYGSNLPTWEINPSLNRDSPDIKAAFDRDPLAAMRDFGASPTSTANAFYPRNVVSTLFNGAPNTHLFQYQTYGEDIWGKVIKKSSIAFPSVMALDAGYSNNSFAVSVAYYDFDIQKIRVACVLECMPSNGTKVNFTKLYKETLLPLIKDLNCVYVLADQWNSIDLLQRIKEDGGKAPNGKAFVTPAKYTLKREDFDSIVAMFKNGNVILPTLSKREIDSICKNGVANYKEDLYNKPVQHLLLQLLNVVDRGPGRCPDKAPGYTDDISRAMALSIVKIMSPKIMAKLTEARQWIINKQSMPEPIILGKSGRMIF